MRDPFDPPTGSSVSKSFLSPEETLEYCAAIQAAATDAETSPDDMAVLGQPEWFRNAPTGTIEFERRLPFSIPVSPGIITGDRVTIATWPYPSRAHKHEYDNFSIGLSKYYLLGPPDRRVPFYAWTGARDLYVMGSSLIFVAKKNLWKFYRTFRESQRQTKPISVPVLPDNVLKDIYDNTVGFILGGKLNREKYEKHNIPYRRGVLLAGKPGCGKCCAYDTITFTNHGMIPIGHFVGGLSPDTAEEVEVSISNMFGKMESAAQIYNGGFQVTKSIRTRRGFGLTATHNHRVISTDGKRLTWKRTDEIKVGDYVAIPRGMNLFGQQIDLGCPTQNVGNQQCLIPNKMTTDLAYLLGLLVGDGGLTTGNRITFHTTELADVYRNLFLSIFGVKPGVIEDQRSSTGLVSVCVESVLIKCFLRMLGLSDCAAPHKTVPISILRAPKEIVAAFLQGLFDTDGWSDSTGRVGFSSSSLKLARTVHLILTNFGIIGNLYPKRNDFSGAWTVDITGQNAELFYETIGFRVIRKQSGRYSLSNSHQNNFDIIPLAPEIISTVVSKVKPRNPWRRYETGQTRMSRVKAKEFMELASGCSSVSELCGDMILWDTIVEIQDTEDYVADFYVPKTHSFAGGGFMNHNTMSCKWIRDLCHKKHIDTEIITLDKYRRRMSEGNVMSIFRGNVERPKIVFFDDLDVMIRDRKSGNIDIYNFLSGLDGLETKEGVVNIFTTNQMDDLDEAFVRPGRIDLFVPFSAPSAKLRKAFVDKKFGECIRNCIDVDLLISKTEDHTFAELEEIRKLLCFDEIAGKTIDLEKSLGLFERHREQFKERAQFGFNRMVDDDEDFDREFVASAFH
jgi:hypothetical protein